MNPINGKKKYFDLKQVKGIIAKIKDVEERLNILPTIETVQKIVNETMEKKEVRQDSSETYESKIVCSEDEIIQLSNCGYDCQFIGHEKWLMRKKVIGQTGS